MRYEIPESAIETEGFKIKSPANLFFLYMLSRNWHAWAEEYKPVKEFSQEIEGSEEVANQLLQATDKNYWTVVGVDQGEYLEPGVTVYSNLGYYTHGFIETEKEYGNKPWVGQLSELIAQIAELTTIEYPYEQPIRTVYVTCDQCDPDEVDDCEHWDGETGSWVSVDFDSPGLEAEEQLLRSVAQNSELGSLSEIAQSLLAD